MKTHKRTPQVTEPPKGSTYVLRSYVAADQIVFCTVCKLQFRRDAVSMATENRTFVATENCTLLGRTSRAERTFSR